MHLFFVHQQTSPLHLMLPFVSIECKCIGQKEPVRDAFRFIPSVLITFQNRELLVKYNHDYFPSGSCLTFTNVTLIKGMKCMLCIMHIYF